MSSRRLLGGRRPEGPKRIGGAAAPDSTRIPAQPAPAKPEDPPSAGRVVGSSAAAEPLLEVTDLVVRYPLPKAHPFAVDRFATAVDGVSFTVARGEALGLVGESGSGKSSTARAITQLHRPAGGRVRFAGTELTALRGATLRRARQGMQMVFQDPYASLDPRQTAAAIVAEPLRNFHLASRCGGRRRGVAHRAARRQAIALLEQVGLSAAMADRYPHEFSGGQRQRIGIARALAPRPDLLLCDEPVSGLDVSVRAQVLNLLLDLRRDLGLALLFIAHDLAVVRHLCDRIAVMQAGRIVETAATDVLFAAPAHPYTRQLLTAILPADPAVARARLATHVHGTTVFRSGPAVGAD